MKIFGICVAKNEADILPYTLRAARKWCDEIFILDNGSTDGTWELVKNFAKTDPGITAWKQDPRPFTEAMRADVFNEFRHYADQGDWWCRLDADEIYVESPRRILAAASCCEVVWALHLQYYFSDLDLAAYNSDPAAYSPIIPPFERYRWYLANASEPRFFKYRKRLQWNYGAWPKHMGRVCKERVPLRHYQYRTPSQIQRRVDDRLTARRKGSDSFQHVSNADWKSTIVSHATLHFDEHNGIYQIDDGAVPAHRDHFFRLAVKNIMRYLGIWP